MTVASHVRALRRDAETHRSQIGFPPLPKPEITITLFVLMTVFAVSPIGRDIDAFFHLEPVTKTDGGVYWFLSEVLDRLSSQKVVGLLMTAMALGLGWYRKTLAPLIIVGLAELAFLATGVVKILVGKNAPKFDTPTYWSDGLLEHGKYSMAYPSGHAFESVAFWGVILLLLVMYAPGWTRHHTLVGTQLWNVVIVQTSVVSWLLGRHWVTDLAGGVLFGLLCFSLIYGLTYRGYPQAIAVFVERQIATVAKSREAGSGASDTSPGAGDVREPPPTSDGRATGRESRRAPR